MTLSAIVLVVLASIYTECIQYEGTEFIIAFCEHKTGRSAPSLGVINYNDDPVRINISMPGAPELMKTYTGVVRTTYTLSLPEEAIQLFTSVKSLAVYITSNDSVVVNGFNTAHFSIGGFIALPVNELGREYITVNHCQTHVCIIMIVGTRNRTLCHIHLNSGSGSVRLSGTLYKSGDVMLLHVNRFETIQLQSGSDLSGSRIYSDHPVAVFVGSDYTIADFGENSIGKDNFVEQLIPIVALGTYYLVPSLASRINRPFQLKVVASDCNTTVTISSLESFVIPKGSHMTKRLSPKKTYSIKATARVLVVVIINSWGYYKLPHNRIDGSFCILQPVDIVKIAMNRGSKIRIRTMIPEGKVDLTAQTGQVQTKHNYTNNDNGYEH